MKHFNKPITILTMTSKEVKGMTIATRMEEIRNTDRSFTEPETWLSRFLGINNISQEEAREIWLKGIEIGMIEGMLLSGKESPGKSREELSRLKEEFLEKYLELSHGYGFGIRYDKIKGLEVVELDKRAGKETV